MACRAVRRGPDVVLFSQPAAQLARVTRGATLLPALGTWLQEILVDPSTKSETVEILRGLRDRYEDHHHVQITDDAVEAAVELSSRYVTGRCLPDKAIDVIDEAGARVRIKSMIPPPDIRELLTQIDADEVYSGQVDAKLERSTRGLETVTHRRDHTIAHRDIHRPANQRCLRVRCRPRDPHLSDRRGGRSREREISRHGPLAPPRAGHRELGGAQSFAHETGFDQLSRRRLQRQ